MFFCLSPHFYVVVQAWFLPATLSCPVSNFCILAHPALANGYLHSPEVALKASRKPKKICILALFNFKNKEKNTGNLLLHAIYEFTQLYWHCPNQFTAYFLLCYMKSSKNTLCLSSQWSSITALVGKNYRNFWRNSNNYKFYKYTK